MKIEPRVGTLTPLALQRCKITFKIVAQFNASKGWVGKWLCVSVGAKTFGNLISDGRRPKSVVRDGTELNFPIFSLFITLAKMFCFRRTGKKARFSRVDRNKTGRKSKRLTCFFLHHFLARCFPYFPRPIPFLLSLLSLCNSFVQVYTRTHAPFHFYYYFTPESLKRALLALLLSVRQLYPICHRIYPFFPIFSFN